MLRVRDIMSQEVVTLSPELPAAEAARRLAERGISGAPVVADGRVVGVLSKSDLAHPDTGAIGEPDARTEDIMTGLALFVRPDDRALLAAQLMLRERIHRLVVLEPDGSLAGIITTTDLLRAVSDGHALVDASLAVELGRHAEASSDVPEDEGII